MSDITEEFRNKMTEWVELKKQLTEARKDMKVLNQKEKELKEYIGSFMKEQKIDNINLKKGKVTRRTTQKKASLSRKNVEEGLNEYFQGDVVRVEGAMTCITDKLPAEERDVISLTGIKDKNTD
jgi:hypothetical protein